MKLWSVAWAGLLAAPCVAQNSCLQCHGPVAALELDKPHQRAGIGCVDCHGGDATAQSAEAAKAPETGYRILDRGSWPNLCGDCHADVRRMNPFGIPTDQLAQYRTSRHGEVFFEDGDQMVATCVDCHGSHGVLDVRNPESPVHPRNIPATCSKCHSNPAVIDEYGFEGNEEASYRASVHAALLFEKGDLSAPQCATCHGNHGAVPPGFADIGSVCGQCHIRQKELFDQSPHARLVESGDFGACVSCHSYHEVLPAGEHILERMCNVCHGRGDPGLEIRDSLLEELRSAGQRFESSGEQLERALRHGYAGDSDQLLLENARTSLMEMQALQHSLDPDLLERTSREIDSTLDRFGERVVAAESIESLKRAALWPVLVFLGAMSFGFWIRFRRVHQKHREVH